MKVEWVFFDLGSTLTDEGEFMEYLFRRVFESLKHRGAKKTWEVFQGNLQRIVKERNYGSGVWDILRTAVGHFIGEKETVEMIMGECRSDAEVVFKYLELMSLHPETVAVLERLNRMHHLGLIANQPQGVRKKLAKLGILKYFKVIALSSEIGYGKPDPKIFLQALREAGCPAHKALMIGDRLDNDIAPAKMVGMITIRVKRGLTVLQKPRNDLEKPDHEIDTLEALLELLSSVKG